MEDRYTFDPNGDLRFILRDPNNPSSKVQDEPGSTTISHGITMLASSRHLILASPVFKAMLDAGRFLEGSILASQKQVEIPLPDDDAAAFEIILNIIHGRTRKVTKIVTFDLLVKLSVLVDKYQLHEPVEVFSDHWIQNIRASFPTQFGSELPPWLCIAWVFDQPAEFKRLTLLAILNSSKSLKGSDTDRLPIPIPILEDIEYTRTISIKRLIDTIQRLLQKYRGDAVQCASNVLGGVFDIPEFGGSHREECDAMMLGRLEKIAISAGIEPPPPGPEYDGIVLETLYRKLSNFELHSLCDRINRVRAAPSFAMEPFMDAHYVKERLRFDVDSIRKAIAGLNIANYKMRERTNVTGKSGPKRAAESDEEL